MARPQNRKRPHADELLRDESPRDDPPAKKIKSADESNDSWEYPPEFWDRLSKIPLTRNALREFNRRTSTQRSFPPPGPPHFTRSLTRSLARELARIAWDGGPDLCDLRGYPEPRDQQPTGAMSSDQSSRSRATKSTNPTSIATSSGTTKSKKSSRTPYDRGFEQHLTDHAVHAIYESQEPNLGGLLMELAVPRRSLSPSQFSTSAFNAFRMNNAQAKDEDDVLADVVPTICGPREADHPMARNTVFNNLDPLTDGNIAPPKPDIYYGAHPKHLDRAIREKLSGHIVPSSTEDRPIAPNFFLEVKGPRGVPAVATAQARHVGAVGARTMHELQNCYKDKPAYDGNAYTFSSTYHGGTGTLQLFAHHTTAPKAPGDRPEYHMTQIDSWGMTGNINTFRSGATAFRNARDLAKRHRDAFIQEANFRAAQTQTVAAPGLTEVPEDDGPTISQDIDDALQQHIANTTHYTSDEDDEESPIPQYLSTEDDSQGRSQECMAPDESSMSFASSFTSSFTPGDQNSSKRPRQSLSPHLSSKELRSTKSQTSPNVTRRVSKLAAPAEGAPQTSMFEPHCVETFWRGEKLCFRSFGGQEIETEPQEWVRITVDGTRRFRWQSPTSGLEFWAADLAEKLPSRKGTI